MGGYKRVFAIAFIWGVAAVGWMVLGGVTAMRKETQSTKLRDGVQNLWGSPQVQTAPALPVRVGDAVEPCTAPRSRTVCDPGQRDRHREAPEVVPARLDAHRRRPALRPAAQGPGLVLALRRASSTRATATCIASRPAGSMTVRFAFPDKSAIYDDFRFVVNGKDYAGALDAERRQRHRARSRSSRADEVKIELGYKSRGLDSLALPPDPERRAAARLRAQHAHALPRHRLPGADAFALEPQGHGGRLGAALALRADRVGLRHRHARRRSASSRASSRRALAFSAPISLLFYFLVLFVLATLRGIDIHPINYFFLAGAFFAFHLLFAYSVDHLTVETAFALCSVVSIAWWSATCGSWSRRASRCARRPSRSSCT